MNTRKVHPSYSHSDISQMGDDFTKLIHLRTSYLAAAAAFISLHPEIITIVKDGKAFIAEERASWRREEE